MNFLYSLLITLFFIAGSTSASEAFKDNGSISAEVKAYCEIPAEYKNSKGGKKYGPIEEWNVSAVTYMGYLFNNLMNCNPDISKWDVSTVKEFKHMFHSAASFNQDLSEWDVANGERFDMMFWGAATFNQDLSKWDVGNGHDFYAMFYGAAAFNQDLSEWNVGNGHDFEFMFYSAAAFNQDLSRWDVGNGRGFEKMFAQAVAFNQDLSEWNVTNGQNFEHMFTNSGMNYFIGEWDFKSMGNDAERISVFISMLGVKKYDDVPHDEVQQLINFVSPTCTKKSLITLLADLIALAADKGMGGKEFDKLMNKIDDINQLMNMDDN